MWEQRTFFNLSDSMTWNILVKPALFPSMIRQYDVVGHMGGHEDPRCTLDAPQVI